MTVVKGLLTRGLGGDATNVILSKFSLGFITVTVEPVPPDYTGGFGSVYIPDPEEAFKLVTITVRYKSQTWKKTYLVRIFQSTVIIKVIDVINKITTNISIAVRNMRKMINKLRIKR